MATSGIPVPGAQGPPVAPDVTAQQMPPMSAFAGQGGQTAPQNPQSDFLVAKLNEVAASLTDVAKIVSQTNPELMPIVQKMAQAGAMLMNEVQSGQGGQSLAPGGGQEGVPSPGLG